MVSTQSDLCLHFGECGGCATQDLPYAEQLRQKEETLRELFKDFWPHPIPVTPSPVQWNYRNKVDFNFAPKQYPEPPPKGFDRETVLGFNRKGKWYWPLAIDECRIGPPSSKALLESVRAWTEREGHKAFNSKTRNGFLRVLLVREGARTGDVMVVLVTTQGDLNAESFIDAVRAAVPAKSIYHAVFHGLAQGAFADELFLLAGDPYIEEKMCVGLPGDERELRYRISPFSFFQTNTLAAELLYTEIRNWVRATQAKVLYDLYGGMGGIAFTCADLVSTVRSVDNAYSSAQDGIANQTLNGIENVYFSSEKMKNYLLHAKNEGGMESTSAVIVDPPRAGMHPKAIKRLIECRPPHILYISCNPPVLSRELPAFLKNYTVKNMQAVDLFPHTKHVELITALTLR